MADDEPGILQSTFDGWDESVDGVGCESEEVEVARLAANVTANDKRGTAGKREALCFLQAGDDLGDPLL